MNTWLKRCVFNLDLNRESVSETRTLSGRLFQSLGAKYEKVLPPLFHNCISAGVYIHCFNNKTYRLLNCLYHSPLLCHIKHFAVWEDK